MMMMLRSFSVAVLVASTAGLTLPPSTRTYKQPLGVIRESIAHLMDPDGFVAERAASLGPVFLAGMFFRPTVFVGGPDNIEEFQQKERFITESCLPPTFATLHTKYGALNQQGEAHKASRRAFSTFLSGESLSGYLPLIEARTSEFVDVAAARGETQLAGDLKSFYLDLMAELFTGAPLSAEEKQLFIEYAAALFLPLATQCANSHPEHTLVHGRSVRAWPGTRRYNGGLLALGTIDPRYKAGERALATLRETMAARLTQAAPRLPNHCLATVSPCVWCSMRHTHAHTRLTRTRSPAARC